MLKVDAEGKWFHDNMAVKHARLELLLHRSVARDEKGSLIVTTGRDVLPFECDDTPLFVREFGNDPLRLILLGDRELSTPPRLTCSADGVFRVRYGSFWARVLRSATHWLWNRIEDDANGAYVALNGGKRWSIEPLEQNKWTD